MRAGTPAWLPSTRGWMARDATHAHESVQKPTVVQGSLQSLWIHRCLPESSRSPKKQKDLFFFFLWCWLRSLLVTHRFLAGKACHCSKKSLVSRQEKRCCQNYRVAYHRPYRKFDSLEMPDFLTKPKKKKASHLTTSIPIWGERSEATAQVFSGSRKQWAGLEFLTVNALVVESW